MDRQTLVIRWEARHPYASDLADIFSLVQLSLVGDMNKLYVRHERFHGRFDCLKGLRILMKDTDGSLVICHVNYMVTILSERKINQNTRYPEAASAASFDGSKEQRKPFDELMRESILSDSGGNVFAQVAPFFVVS